MVDILTIEIVIILEYFTKKIKTFQKFSFCLVENTECPTENIRPFLNHQLNEKEQSNCH